MLPNRAKFVSLSIFLSDASHDTYNNDAPDRKIAKCRFLLPRPIRIYVARHGRRDLSTTPRALSSLRPRELESGPNVTPGSPRLSRKSSSTHRARLPARIRAGSKPAAHSSTRPRQPPPRQIAGRLSDPLARPGLSRNLEYIRSTDRADLVESAASARARRDFVAYPSKAHAS